MEDTVFPGFRKPTKGYFSLPNEWTDITAKIDSLAELKIIEYVIRHTWGFNEHESFKKLTTDEFMHGRKRSDGTRMDSGTGLSDWGVKDGIKRAIEHGYIICNTNAEDLARIKKYYGVKMLDANSDGRISPIQDNSDGSKPLTDRSKPLSGTENTSHRSGKPTGETDSKKDTSYTPTINQSKSKDVPKDVSQMIRTICNKYDKATGRENMGKLLDIYQKCDIEDPGKFKQLMQDVRSTSTTIEQFLEKMEMLSHESH